MLLKDRKIEMNKAIIEYEILECYSMKRVYGKYLLRHLNPVGIVHGALNPVHNSGRLLNLSSPWQAMGHSYGVNTERERFYER
jgi:hypothetical protein